MNPFKRLVIWIDGLTPRERKLAMYILWILAPIEMACITLGLYGFKKIKGRMV